MDALHDQVGVVMQLLRRDFVERLHARAGIGKAAAAICMSQILKQCTGDVFGQQVEVLLLFALCDEQVELCLLFALGGDVDMDADHAQHAPLGIAFDDLATVQHPQIAAILAAHAVSVFINGALTLEIFLEVLLYRSAIFRMYDLDPGPEIVAEFFGCVAQMFFPQGRDENLFGLCIPLPDALIAGVEYGAPAGIMLGKLLEQGLLHLLRFDGLLRLGFGKALTMAMCLREIQQDAGAAEQGCIEQAEHPGAQGPGGVNVVEIAADSRNQGLIHVQLRRLYGMHGHHACFAAGLHLPAEYAGCALAVAMLAEHGAWLGEILHHALATLGCLEELQASAMHQGGLRALAEQHGIEQRAEVFRLQGGDDQAGKLTLWAGDQTRHHDGPGTEHGLERRAHIERVRVRCLKCAEVVAARAGVGREDHGRAAGGRMAVGKVQCAGWVTGSARLLP